MKREIKFRAWDSTNSVMIPFIDLKPYGDTYVDRSNGVEAMRNLPNGVHITSLMQCTGLKDKNGKEIYEGCIIRALDEVFSVVYNPHMARYDLKTSSGYSESLVPEGGEWYDDEHEIIGNVYENPELLK